MPIISREDGSSNFSFIAYYTESVIQETTISRIK
jgi:hypothetical protein